MNKKQLLFAVIAGCSVLCPTVLAAEKGKLGLFLDIAVEGGFFSPTLGSVKVNTLTKGAAADKAGVLVGDQILQIADCVIPGCPADEAKALMKKKRGESVTFLIKEADGMQRIKTVIAE